jgi:OmpA-OmpF porin, OOP family
LQQNKYFMEQHAYNSDDHKKPGYLPAILIVAVLFLLAWLLLHNYNGDSNKGYIWKKYSPENVKNDAESNNGTEEHEGSTSRQEVPSGDLIPASAVTGMLDNLTGNFIYETGIPQPISLPDSSTFSVGANSSESKLVQFLSSDASVDTVDKTKGWITLDRFYFETGKSTITRESQAQLKNIAAILKAYPNANLKIGGYTDNSGNPQANKTLSDSRANAAKNALVALGVAANRLQAEGYGQEHPLAENNTPEGKARNRRVDVRVVKK